MQIIKHPLWLLSLAVLVINDHALKGAGLVPAWLTGKLSDFAGFFLLPTLLWFLARAVLGLGKHPKVHFVASHGVALVLLLLLELSPGFCSLLKTTFGILLWPDPSDLLAALSIGLSYLLFRNQVVPATKGFDNAPHQTPLGRVLLTSGALASVATSPVEPPRARTAEMFLHNGHTKAVDVRISLPRPEIQFNCESKELLAAPQRAFSASMFRAASHVSLAPGGTFFLDNLERLATRQDGSMGSSPPGCYFALLQVEGNQDLLLSFRRGQFPPVDVTAEPTARISIAAESATVSGPKDVLFPLPQGEDPVAPSCAPPKSGSDPETNRWPLIGPALLQEISRGVDGCDALILSDLAGKGRHRFYVCADPLRLPFAPLDVLSYREAAFGQGGVVEASRGPLQVGTLTLGELNEGSETSPLSPACGPVRQSCTSTMNLAVVIPTPVGKTKPLRAGESSTVVGSSLQTQVYVNRAEQALVRDSACEGVPRTLGFTARYVSLTTPKEMK